MKFDLVDTLYFKKNKIFCYVEGRDVNSALFAQADKTKDCVVKEKFSPNPNLFSFRYLIIYFI